MNININTYTIKEIAFFTGLGAAKIRSLIKNGTINAEMVNTVNDSGRKVKRLEVTEENLAAFAFANPELAGPLLNMDIVQKYAPKNAEDYVKEIFEELDVAEPHSEAVETADDGWDPAEFTSDDVVGGFESVDNNEEAPTPDTPTIIADVAADEKTEESPKSEKEEMLAALHEIEQSIVNTIDTIDEQIEYYSGIVNDMTAKRNGFSTQLLDLQAVIDHIDKHM